MSFNPEIRRNIWLEFSTHRLIAMPIVLGVIFFITGEIHVDVPKELAATALTLYFLLVKLWGGHKAAEAVVEEVNEHTWDFQKLSALSPWRLTLGKLFGPTLYTWYGAAIVMVVYVAAAAEELPAYNILLTTAMMLAGGLIVHTAAILSGMVAVQGPSSTHKRYRTLVYHLFGLILGSAFALPFGFGLWDKAPSIQTITWYGQDYVAQNFIAVTAFLLLGWLVAGIYWMMRNEMKMRTGPWLWTGFLIFWAWFLAGSSQAGLGTMVISNSMHGSLTAFFVTFAGLYYIVFQEPWSGVRYRRLVNAWRTGNMGMFLAGFPRWLASLLLCFLVAMVVMTSQNPDFPPLRMVALLGFAVRDIAILHYFRLTPGHRRPLQSAVFYLGVLYILLPFLFGVLHLHELTKLFGASLVIHDTTENCVPVAISACIQAAITVTLAATRWQRNWVGQGK